MPLAGRSPRSRALAHYQWAGRYSRNEAEPERIAAHLDRASHYMRLSSTRFGVGSVGAKVPDSVMVGVGGGGDDAWFPARDYQNGVVEDLVETELKGVRDYVVPYKRDKIVMSCYRSPLTGGVYILTYPLSQKDTAPDETVKQLVNSSIQKNNSRSLRGVNSFIRVVEDWRKDRLQIHTDTWYDARPYQKFAYFDFMLRTKEAGERVIYLNELHRKLLEPPATTDEVVQIPALYDVRGNVIMLTMERDATDPAAIYLIREDDATRRYRMSDSKLVKKQESEMDKDTRQRRPGGAGASDESAGASDGGAGASGSGSKKRKWAQVARPRTVKDAYDLMDIQMLPNGPDGGPSEDEKDVLTKAYKKLLLELHPDKGGNEEDFKLLGIAMKVIQDERFTGKVKLNKNFFGAVR